MKRPLIISFSNYLMGFIICCLLIESAGCGKYDDGPKFSLRSKKERLSNKWRIEKYMQDGSDKTDQFNTLYKSYQFEIVKSGAYQLSYDSLGKVLSDEGTWRFKAGDNTTIEYLSNKNGALIKRFHILRLKEKELWYYMEENSVRSEFHMKP